MHSGTNFKQIYDQHARMVYNLCLNYLRNAQDAEEVTQDVFVKIHGGMDRFRGESELRTWIYRVAINASLDHIKGRKRKKRSLFSMLGLVDDAAERVAGSPFDHPGVLMEDQEATQRIFELIDHLPEKQRTAILLRSTEGLGQTEIAEVMNMSVKAVESLLARGRQFLRKELQENEG